MIHALSMQPEPYKVCPFCKQAWGSIDEFLSDPELILSGYQVAFEDLFGGLFMFTHMHEGCGTTMSVAVMKFTSLTNQPILKKRTEPSEKCPGMCMRQNDLSPCPVECECNWVREVLKKIKTWPKKAA